MEQQRVRAVSAGQAHALWDLWRRMVRLDRDYHDTGLGPKQVRVMDEKTKKIIWTPSVHDFVQAATGLGCEEAMHWRSEHSKAMAALQNIRDAYFNKVVCERMGKGQVPGYNRWAKTFSKICETHVNDPKRAKAEAEKLEQCLDDVGAAIKTAAKAMEGDADHLFPRSQIRDPKTTGYVPWTTDVFKDDWGNSKIGPCAVPARK